MNPLQKELWQALLASVSQELLLPDAPAELEQLLVSPLVSSAAELISSLGDDPIVPLPPAKANDD